ncbi:protein phosphatase 2C domain-containing protein [Rugamonas sp.]|uniref:PP2C family protein-serine/threonine phosphatase n=1 Tax=Rugamonas sp. TaxID=1926287 RepID=UPI0025DD2120|nr:protein phosphatase 2C domain-containing protein [Rugamonas sp.]
MGATDIGVARDNNEDNFLIDADLGLLAVADGMGGHDGGEIASAEAIVLLQRFLHRSLREARADTPPSSDHASAQPDDAAAPALDTLRHALAYANAGLYQANLDARRADGAGMGTTLTGLWQAAPAAPVLMFHVGDSRLYRRRGGALTQLTRDQTLYQQALDLDAPPPLPPRNVLLQALGPAALVEPELQVLTVAPGDVYLLCSDGMHGDSQAQDIGAIMALARPDNLQRCCHHLIELAKRDGSRDNITVLLLTCPH